MALNAVPTADYNGVDTPWTPTPCWSRVDEDPASDSDFISVVVTGFGIGYEIILSLTKDVGTFTTAQLRFRAKVTNPGLLTARILADNGLTVIHSELLPLTTSFTDQTMNLNAGAEVTAFNAATNPKLSFIADEGSVGETFSVSYARVVGDSGSPVRPSFLNLIGVSCLAALPLVFGPSFCRKSSHQELRAYPAGAAP
jgi:hypothetical protein